jgi:YegS/Rv2252/BmrU family lipid kinase
MRTILIDNISNQKESEELRSIVSKDYPEIKVYKSNGFGQIPGIISKIIQRKPEIIISAGGDGTINNIINNLMKSNKDQIKNIKLSVIHGGKANDLARILEIPKDTKQALKQILKGKSRKIDLIKVNQKYFITGGGFGLPAHIIKLKNKGGIFNFMKDSLYLLLVLKSFIFGYQKVEIIKINNTKRNNLMLVSVMNQDFIGKRFFLNPEAKNNDGTLNICLIKDSFNIFKRFYRLNKVINKEHKNHSWSEFMKFEKMKISLDKKTYFMADGELLELSKEFNFSVIPKALNFIS